MAITLTTVRDRPSIAWGIRIMRVVGFAALAVPVWAASPRPSWHGRGLAVAVTLAVAAVAWLTWTFMDGRTRRLTVPLTVLAVAGGLLAALSPRSPAVALAAVAVLAAGGALAPEVSIGIAVAAALALAVGALLVDVATLALVSYLIVIAAGLSAGFVRLGYRQRAEQAELLLEQTRRATLAEAEAAALGERTRIAREIHDILSHSLGALSLQLEAAHALLGKDSVPQENADIARTRQCLDRAGQLTREGLTESRRAILALREDVGPLPEMIERLVRSQNSDGASVTFSTTGTPRHLAADAALTLYRTAQEAASNARKHAPGAPVTMDLVFGEDDVQLTVSNPLADDGSPPTPLSATGGGLGLIGLRERAELAGGTLTAGPADGRWRVCATIPG